MNHINFNLIAEKNSQYSDIYSLHKFWSRKPANVVAEYIKAYTEPNDLVLDPFSGSGVTAIESIRLGRRVVAIDLNPVSSFILKNSVVKIDIAELDRVFEEIQEVCKNKIYDKFLIKCSKCNRDTIANYYVWEHGVPVKVRYLCKKCSKNIITRDLTSSEANNIKKFAEKDIDFWYPKTKIPIGQETNRLLKAGINYYYQLFSPRALWCLSFLFSEIQRIKNRQIKDVMNVTFTSALDKASKLNSIDMREGKEYSSRGWTRPTYWVPDMHLEHNVWESFENRYLATKHAKIDSNKNISAHIVDSFDDLIKGKGNILIKTGDALSLDEFVSEDTVDYIFTDPPYGGIIQYNELTGLWNAWLDFETKPKDEVIINKYQDKDADIYYKMMVKAFSKMRYALKPRKYLTLTFHNTDQSIFNGITKAAYFGGFNLEKIVFQPPAMTVKALSQPYGSVLGDFYIRFLNVEGEGRKEPGHLDKDAYERIIVETAKHVIAQRNEPCLFHFIRNKIYEELNKHGLTLSDDRSIEEVLEEHLDEEFKIIEDRNKGKVVGRRWWFKDVHLVPHLRDIPLNERVEQTIISLLNKEVKISYTNIFQKLYTTFPNSITPETDKIDMYLNEYAEKTSDGNWRLKSVMKSRQEQHPFVINIIVQIGKKLGYKIWIGVNEQQKFYSDKKKLIDQCTNKELKLKHIDGEKLDRIKHIDVLWYDEDKIIAEFEVENSTGITEAFTRGSNIPYKIKRYVVIPEERESLLRLKIGEPIVKDIVLTDNWNFIYYTKLQDFFNTISKKTKLSLRQFEEIVSKKARIDNSGQREFGFEKSAQNVSI